MMSDATAHCRSGRPRFVGEKIIPRFADPARLVKKPGPPASFAWRGETYRVTRVLFEWHDFGREPHWVGSWTRPPYAVRSGSSRGSWGVGRDYYRVETDRGLTCDIYYDRRPRGGKREGEWVLFAFQAPA
jgi:hypothetical protein